MEITIQRDDYDLPKAFEEAQKEAFRALGGGNLQLTLIQTSLVWHQRDRVTEQVWKFRFLTGYMAQTR